MPDLSITASSVIQGSDAKTKEGIAGATLAAGDSLYIDTADENKLKLFDANAVAPANDFAGIALHGASSGQPIEYQYEGDITLGSVLTQGHVYIGSNTPGKIAPVADLDSGWTTNVIGVAKSASILTVKKVTAGVAVA